MCQTLILWEIIGYILEQELVEVLNQLLDNVGYCCKIQIMYSSF